MTDWPAQLTRPGSFAQFCGFMNPALQPFHFEWANLIAVNDQSLALGPRGHWKSTVCCQYQALWRLARNPNARICIISNDSREAKKDLRYIKNHMSNNRELVNMFPHLAPSHTLSHKAQRDGGKMWKEDAITISGGLAVGEANIIAVGVYGGVTGQHYEHIILDDCVDFDNCRTEYQRQKLLDWIAETVEGTLMDGGTMTYIGTRYHWQDLYGGKIQGDLSDRHVIHSAIHYDDDGKEHALAESIMRLKELKARRRRMGTAKFNSQYQNDTAAMQSSKFKPDYFRYWTELPDPKRQIKYIAIDTSMGKTIHSDFTAWCVIIADSSSGDIFVIEAGHERLNLEGRRALVRRLNEKHPDAMRIGIEGVGFAEDFVTDIKKEISKCISLDQQYGKEIRAEKIEPLFEAGKVHFGSDGIHDALEQELLMFPEGKYDDLFDALEMAIRLATEGSSGSMIVATGDSIGEAGWRRNRRDGWSPIA